MLNPIASTLWYNFFMKPGRKNLTLTIHTGILVILLAACNAISLPVGTPTPKVGVTLSPLPSRTSTPQPENLNPGVEIPTPTPTQHLYVVQKDELGWTIAARFKVTLPLLQAANPEVDLNFLQEGAQLIIPPPVDTPSPILYTPTPVALEISAVHCYPTIDQDLWCLVNISNHQKNDAYYITGEFRLASGGQVFSKTVAGLADRLPAGGQLPLIGLIPGPIHYPFEADFSLTSAFTAEEVNVAPLTVENIATEIDPDGLWATVQGEIVNSLPNAVKPSVIVSAYQGDLPAGIRKLEITEEIQPGGRMPFTVEVYSAGLPIERVDILAEGK